MNSALFLARQTALDRVVVLKVFRPKENRLFRDRCTAFAAFWGKLDYPAIVRALDFREHDGRCYCAMEYIRGPSLAARLEHGDSLGERSIVHVVHTLASALQCFHEAGGTHGRLIPEKVLLTELDGARLLMNFSPLFSSPGADGQLAQEQRPDIRSDLHALGVLLRKMLQARGTGKADLACGLQGIMNRLLQADTGQRYQTPSELLADLNKYAGA